MFTRKLADPLAVRASRSRSASARGVRADRARISASRSLRPTSRPGTSASCRTAPACRPAAARRRRARRSSRRSAPRATARTARAASTAALVGGQPLTSGIETTKTIANFWPYATTLFDFTRRAMPWPKPRTLTNDEVYALTAYILALNKIIGENDVMNAQTLPKVRMPNRDGFIIRFPEKL